MVSERLGPLSSCSSSLCRRAVFVWMLLSSCSLRCLISDSSSPKSTEPEEGMVVASWVVSLDTAHRYNGGQEHSLLLQKTWRGLSGNSQQPWLSSVV